MLPFVDEGSLHPPHVQGSGKVVSPVVMASAHILSAAVTYEDVRFARKVRQLLGMKGSFVHVRWTKEPFIALWPAWNVWYA